MARRKNRRKSRKAVNKVALMCLPEKNVHETY